MEEKKLEEMYQMVQDNNRMLRAMRRAAFIGGIVKIVWWVFLLVVFPYVTWIFLQPYLGGALDTYQRVQGQTSAAQATVGGLNLTQIKDLLKDIGATNGQ
jgi:hypothetical protein